MTQYFETSVKYDKLMENGAMKKVTEKFLVDSLSFAEAEARTVEERAPYMSGGFDVRTAKKSKISEIFNLGAERYYLVKVGFITIDEKSAIEQRSITQILVGANDFDEALKVFKDGMKGTTADFEIVSISETQILEVYPAKLA